jgi:hypothetical protein
MFSLNPTRAAMLLCAASLAGAAQAAPDAVVTPLMT